MPNTTAILSLELSNPPKLIPLTLHEALFPLAENSRNSAAGRHQHADPSGQHIPEGEEARSLHNQPSKRPALRRSSSTVVEQSQLRQQATVRFDLSAGRLQLPEAELDFSPRLLLLYFGAGWSVPCVSSTRRLIIAHNAWRTQFRAAGAAGVAADEALDDIEEPAVLYVPSDENEGDALFSFRSSHGGWFALAFDERCARCPVPCSAHRCSAHKVVVK